ncbi:MAG: hypothetical protein IPF74_13320 [Rhodocyclaceae bacterium]|nr:hypothetical protein [Rhodocyclaceae bacterium]
MVDRNPWDGDQADGLRRLFGNRAPQVVAFASGREACGRTTLVVQTAAALAAAGHGVVVVDEIRRPTIRSPRSAWPADATTSSMWCAATGPWPRSP